MRQFSLLAGSLLISVLFGSSAWAQQTGQSNNASNRSAGMQQTGQLSSDAAISRNSSAFVGASQNNFMSRSGASNSGASGLSNMMRGMSALGMSSFGMGGRNGLFGMQGMNNSNQQTVRSVLRIGFTPTRPSDSAVATQFANRLARIPAVAESSGIAVKMDGRTAVLQGAVASQRQAELIGRLALLEPGIRDIRNELTVVAQPPLAPAAESNSP